MAKDLQLSEDETEALKAASVLHDIGKLAVPEHIISKPGKLTPEEFEKMKVHPIVGSEIVQQVRFPYPVAPIVRSHHEKWDGSGYPDGLAGEAIPIGARILAAVDCLDALASDRQYRRALPLDEAMARVNSEAGKSFDPKVVAILQARYRELEHLAREQEPEERPKLSTEVKVKRGAAPAAGFAGTASQSPATLPEALSTVHRLMSDSSLDKGPESPLSLGELLSPIAVRLRHAIPYDAFAMFAITGDILAPCFVLGENYRELSSLHIKVGEGLTGWVAETGQSIVNGNPSVEPGYIEGPHSTPLRSAIAIPLQGNTRIIAVLTLYHAQVEAFSSEHLHFLEKQGTDLGRTIEEYLNRQQPQLLAVRAAAARAGAP
jgi:putative nucleotidyltransferase with HDIG domain